VQSVRDRTHWNMQNVRPRDPVTLGLCTLKDLNDSVDKARRRAAREDAAKKKAAARAGQSDETAPAEQSLDPAEAEQPDPEATPHNCRARQADGTRPSASPCRHAAPVPARHARALRPSAGRSCR